MQELAASGMPRSLSTASRRPRDTRIDSARGLAIVLVVLGHALDGAQSAGFESQVLRFLLLVIYSTHVPLLFLLSGMLAQSATRKPMPEFVADISVRIVWPYLLWSVILLTFQYIFSSYANAPIARYEPFSVFWTAPAVMWFLYVLFVSFVVLRMLAFLPRPALFGLGLLCFILPYLSDELPAKMRFVGVFLAGAGAGVNSLEFARRPVIVFTGVLIMVATVSFAWATSSQSIVGYPAFHLAYLPASIAGPMLVLAMCQLGRGRYQSFFGIVGQHSMAIFVAHILVTAGVRVVLIQLGVASWWLIIGTATILGVVLPLWAALQARRMGFSKVVGW